jgi:hypothetical protein
MPARECASYVLAGALGCGVKLIGFTRRGLMERKRGGVKRPIDAPRRREDDLGWGRTAEADPVD